MVQILDQSQHFVQSNLLSLPSAKSIYVAIGNERVKQMAY